VRTLSPPWRRVLIGSWVMIAVLSVTTLILYVDNKRTKECLTLYIVRDSESTSERVRLTDRERNEFRNTLRTLVDPKSTPESRGAAIEMYIGLLDKNDQIRKENPVEPPPTECN
jgi:hypothetical protein